MKMKEIFIVCWIGRDPETEIWDEYPCFDFGFYTKYETAQAKVDELNKTEPQDYDEEADDIPSYVVQVVKGAK